MKTPVNSRRAAFSTLVGFAKEPNPIDYSKLSREYGSEASRRVKQVFRNVVWLDECIKSLSKTKFKKN